MDTRDEVQLNQEQFSDMEKEAQKWLDETDTMQFSQIELLTMFAAHWQGKNNVDLHNVSKCNCKHPAYGGIEDGKLGFSRCDNCNKQL